MSVDRPVVGWYVHHHGSGHLMRFLAIRSRLAADVVVVSSLEPPPALPADTGWVRLGRDDQAESDRRRGGERLPVDGDPTAGGALHWAPLHHRGHRDRLATIATTMTTHGVDAMVVDVSVEVTALARLLGIPTVVIAQPGRRDDDPHVLGRRLATRLIAPWPAGAHGPTDAVEVGGISRFDGRARSREASPGTVLVLAGKGGFDLSPADLAAASAATPGFRWSALGVAGSPWVDDPWDALCGAEIVIAAAGQNSIADLAAVGARAVVLPQDRPFDEQSVTANALDSRGLAVVPAHPPTSDDWLDLLLSARSLDPDWSAWATAGAAQRAADQILAIAEPIASGHAPRTAIVTLCSEARLDHVRHQASALRGLEVIHVGVWLDAALPPSIPGMTMLHLPPGDHGLRLAEGRNTGASAALDLGASLLVFLDADCVPGGSLLDRYAEAAARHPDALLSGPVTYLGEDQRGLDTASLAEATSPHPARPSPGDGETVVAGADEYRLFWSLSFAVTAETWRRTGGFHTGYQGYGAEDTDFGRAARAAGIPLVWVGGAHAYHQWHPTTSPPWAHLDDILRNAALYADRWGDTPMEGWIDAFAAAGAVESREGRWVRTEGTLGS